jgi:putative ATP-dependent endonuclease of OLD family
MRIKRVHVTNFRCILDEALDCEPLTALVGPNGSGKSTFLRALELFYATSPRVTADDFYNGDASEDIEIAATFTNLSPTATEKFAPYVDKGDLTVVRVLSLKDEKLSTRFYGSRLQNPDFRPIREAQNRTDQRRIYGELRGRAEYSALPTATSADAALAALEEWEQANPGRCTRQRDQGQFFGFMGVGQGYLGDFTHFVLIPAVRDASDEGTEAKGSAITELMDLVVRSTLIGNEELRKFRDETKTRYDQAMASEVTAKRLRGLEEGLASTLKTYVPTAGVRLEWVTEGGVKIDLPRADVKLLEDSYPSPLNRTGHGLQRAFILTLLQHLASERTAAAAGTEQSTTADGSSEDGEPSPTDGATARVLPHLVIAIEEPELYQHPSRQRHLATILLRLADGSIPGVAESTQVIYATHAPLFVGIDRFDQTRLVRKFANGAALPRVARVTRTDADTIAGALWEACGRKDRNGKDIPKFTGESLRPRLQCLMTPWMSEAFFADVVVLVEGEGDRAAILGAALVKGHDFESMGIAVIPCGGKASMDRPALIFKRLGIPTYLVWDGDKNDTNGVRPNHILQRILGKEPADYPTGVNDGCACFETKLEKELRKEFGPVFDAELENCRKEFGYGDRKQAEKNPRVLYEVIRRANDTGAKSPSLEAIVEAIMELHRRGAGR